jgi:NOL1/NOP2/fmu family ribosome biogenesis protein
LRSGNEIIAAASAYENFRYLSENLRVIKSGTRIGTLMKNKFLPDHELAMYVNFKRSACPATEIDYDQAIAFISRETIELNNMPKGWINIRYNDVSLGFVNNIGGRLNNYYPVEWRIRMDLKNNLDIDRIRWI